MKYFFAGLILFSFLNSSAQETNSGYQTNHKGSTVEKMRAVIYADEQQHQAKAPIVLSNNKYHYSTTGTQALRTNYVEDHRSSLLEGLGYGLTLIKSFSRYSNSPNMNYGDMQRYYSVPQNRSGSGSTGTQAGRN